ncbi:MMPL family transporter [Acidothermaceae bacterium B102]|nr:MMPL family transporter [Acidothermaceae bacterium B102]
MDAVFAWVLKHRRGVLIAWLLVTVAGAAVAPSVGGQLQSGFALSSPGFIANQALGKEFGGAGSNPSVLLINLPAGTSVTTPAGLKAVAAVEAKVPRGEGIRAISYATSHDPSLVANGGRATVVLLFPAVAGTDVVDPTVMNSLAAAATDAVPGTTTSITGVEQLSAGSSAGGSSVLTEVLVGSLAALVILAWVFGSVIAFVPLVTALVSILTMLLAVDGLTRLLPGTRFNPAIEFIVAILGLGLSLDYALLVVTRWREERTRGLDNESAVRAACARAGHAVAVSGVTASIGLFALAIVPVSFVRGVGLSGLFVPSIAALVSLTLLPAILRVVGPRLDWPRRRNLVDLDRVGGWDRWGALVVRRRWVALIAGLVLLGGLAGAATQINVAEPQLDGLASSGPASAGLHQLHADGFSDGVLTPLPILVPPGASNAAVARRVAAVPELAGAFAVGGSDWRSPAGTTIVLAVPRLQTAGTGTGQLLADVRRAAPSPESVAGNEVVVADNTAKIYSYFPVVLALVAIVTFVFLARSLRSIVLPLKAVALNLLSVSATYGATVLIWQQGVGLHALFGLRSNGAINALAPILLFGFLFGLSMDYEVFILSRMREAYDRTGSTDTAVVEGIGRTGRLITSAALILFAALISLSTAPDVTVKVIATGLALGVLIDATIVRSLLAPALISLLDRANWWMPAIGARILRIPRQSTEASQGQAWPPPSAERPASSLATGTRNGEQDT